MELNGYIYVITNTKNNKQYIGQTNNVIRRWKDHIYSINKSTLPLHLDMNKFGITNFTFQILEENVPKEQMDEREKYWIRKLHTDKTGYNITEGGNYTCVKSKLTEEQVNEIVNLLQNNIDIISIAEEFGVDRSTISDINTGDSWHNDSLKYPIRPSIYNKKNFSKQDIDDIYKRLKQNESCAAIGRIYNTSTTTICRINNGELYAKDNIDYPISPKTGGKQIPPEKILKIANDLKVQKLNYIQLQKKYSVSRVTIAGINKGQRYKKILTNAGYTEYPIRNVKK